MTETDLVRASDVRGRRLRPSPGLFIFALLLHHTVNYSSHIKWLAIYFAVKPGHGEMMFRLGVTILD